MHCQKDPIPTKVAFSITIHKSQGITSGTRRATQGNDKSPVKCHKRGKIDEKTSRQWEQICETRHFVAINQYVMATIKLTKWGLQYNCQESLSKQFSRQQQSSIHEILIGSTGPGVSYKLRNVYSVSWYCWNIATYEWEIYNWKIEVVSFVV